MVNVNEKIYTIAADEYNALARIKAKLMSANIVTIGGDKLEAETCATARGMGLPVYEVIITLRQV
jgi:hypothetical protein